MQPKLKHILSYILGATLVIGGVVFAGTLTPSVSTDTANFVTLSDIYNKIILNTYSTSTHSISTTSAPVASMHTLSEIYNAIPTLSSGTITTGTTIMGIAGAYNISNLTLGNVATGTAYGTSSVGTLVAAQATEWYTTDTPGDDTDWYTAGTTCAGLSSVGGTKDGSPWRLPSKDELVTKASESHPDFLGDYYWSGTTYPAETYSDVAYFVYISSGSVSYGGKSYPGSNVHCAR